jgi:hypothetical protein
VGVGRFVRKFRTYGGIALTVTLLAACSSDNSPTVTTPEPPPPPTTAPPAPPAAALTQLEEAQLIASLGATEANRTVADFTGADRSFRDELNVFLPSAIDVDEENLRDNTRANVTLPIYEGVGPSGEPTYFIITETSTQETAQALGTILAPKLQFGALPSAAAAAQRVQLNDDGRVVFLGDVDFSPERILVAGEDSVFPPSVAQPGAVGDAEYSSLVVLPSDLVINAQIIANDSGLHDRIIEINLEERWARFELLDGWQGGDRYYYHLVTDASDPVPATIELGVYAPRLANLPTFGDSSLDGESVLLGFSPNINGLNTTENSVSDINRQGLGSTILDQDLDPVNVFPFDPTNDVVEGNNYSPFWDAHLNMWTEEAIANGQRRAITGFADLADLIDQGLVTSFSGNPGIENDFLFGLTASNAVINCPVIMQPFEGSNEVALTPTEEMSLLVQAAANESGRSVEDFTGANRTFSSDLNVFLRNTISIDMETLRDNEQANATLPLFRGIGPQGENVYYILTEASTQEAADLSGTILAPKLRFGSLPAAADAAQRVEINEEGLMVFRGTIDFSPERSISRGADTAFPPSAVQPGGVADDEYSSLVVLPSGLVVNAQIVSNATGNHDRILDIDTDARTATFQLLDGWQGGDPFYYHLVTDASDPVPATIELGVYAPRMANLPNFGSSTIDGETVLLGFSPNVNGLTITEDGLSLTDINRQGLGSTIVDDDRDPVNVFPFDPDNTFEEGNNYSPMWDAHLSMWTADAIANGERRAIRGFQDLASLIEQGSVTSFDGSPGPENAFLFDLRASNAVINCPVILQPFEGELAAGELPSNEPLAPEAEAQLIVELGASEAGREVADFNGSSRSFREELNVFLPSAIDVDEANLRDNELANVTLPIYEGIGPTGEPTYFIITETSTIETSEILGTALAPKLRYGALPGAAAAAQRVQVAGNGRIIFRGDVDFSPERILEPGVDSVFPPSVAQPGSVGDDEYSSLVVLPSGTVINAQIIANRSGVHDRVNSINFEERTVNMQLLDGWQGGDRYYYHLVTDASDPVPATIELGTYAPRMANLPVFGQSGLDGETVLLGFSPNTNGLTVTEDGVAPQGRERQGLSSTILDDDRDPVNIFPFDPDNSTEVGNNYSPMWDAHLNSWTDEAIANGQRREITSFADLADLIDQGLVTSFQGSPGIENNFLFGLRASNAVINCPVILQPFEGETQQ